MNLALFGLAGVATLLSLLLGVWLGITMAGTLPGAAWSRSLC